MPSIYLQTPLTDAKTASLKKEFPHYNIMTACQSPSDWSQIEVLYGTSLNEKELGFAKRLRWIHCSTAHLDGLCIPSIQKSDHISISMTKGQNVPHIAEFVIGSMLAFSKQFFHWPQAPHDPTEFWQWPLKDTMWALNKKVLLQIGLGEVGTAVVKMANSMGMKTWGVRRQRSFHALCHKTFPLKDLHSLLPAADVVVVALPPRGRRDILFKKEEFELMKSDSIFIVVGAGDSIDESALAAVGKKGKFRGVLVDAYAHPPPAKNSPLREIPNVILTPSVASYPESEELLAFPIFRYNLRRFVSGKISEMKNLIIA